ncbi:MAG: SpoIIE family protein phosphatase [Victivallaceae bacterium]|nr:SpoIIE family protein phosphatase [Victivallaceae bacterium]
MSTKIKVLAVDDEKFNLMLISGCLPKNDYEVTGFTNPVEALQTFKKEFFDVILLDIMMPGIDGFELRKLLRKISKYKPIIFLTAMVDDSKSTLLNEVSWDPYTYYMKKSFTQKALKQKIDHVHGIYLSQKQLSSNYNRMEAELTLAGGVQQLLLPSWCVANEHALTSSLYLPKSQVSGDIYEFFQLDEGKYLLFIGDIAGHGISAALYMMAVQSFIKKTTYDKNFAPHVFLNELNEFFCNELGGSSYMTCSVAIIDFVTNHIHMQSAGHPGLFICSSESGVIINSENYKKGGIPAGWFANTQYNPEDNIELDFPDDALIIGVTDGLFDICNENEASLAPSMLSEIIGSLSGSSDAVTFPHRLVNAITQMGYDHLTDDICIVALEKKICDPTLLELLIPPSLPEVSKAAVTFSQQNNNPKTAVKIELLIHEYLNNVIIHGLDNKNSKQRIFLSQKKDEDKIVIRVVDRGRNWNYNPDTEAKTDTDNDGQLYDAAASSGRGLKIIRDITSSIASSSYCGMNESIFTIENKE